MKDSTEGKKRVEGAERGQGKQGARKGGVV